MTTAIRNHRIANVLLLLLALYAAPSLAQNLITNGEFETSGGYDSEYERIYGPNGVGAGEHAIDSTTFQHGGGYFGWPTPANSSGRFMMVNGFGGNTNPTKIVWSNHDPITVTPHTTYTFSCRVANLNMEVNGQFFPAELQVKINGQPVESVHTLPSDNDWHEWSVSWNNQTATVANIAIYDMFTGNSSLGDDYALDGMSFEAGENYTVSANDDHGTTVCQDDPVTIDVLANDVFLPDADGLVIEIVSEPSHGVFSILENNAIQYTFTGGDFASDLFQYRVTVHGYSSEAWVLITLKRPPTLSPVNTPDPICEGGSFLLTDPSIQENGSPVTNQGWQIADPLTGNYDTFDNNNIPYSENGYLIRYFAENTCGTTYGDPVQLTVFSADPTFDTAASCTPYEWNQQTCNHTGDYEVTVQNDNGCDITAHLHFTLLEPTTISVDTTVCEPFSWNGHFIETDGHWSYPLSQCDTIAINVTFIQLDTISSELNSCGAFEFHGITYEQSGTYQIYYDTVFNEIGCMEAVHHLKLTVNDSDQLGSISGLQNVYAATNVISGFYQYEINAPNIIGDVSWSLSNPQWQIIESDNIHCSIFVSDPGSATLEAQYLSSTCGSVVRSLEIHANFYGVDEFDRKANVYPNPTKGTVTIEAEGIESVRVTNLMGQTLESIGCNRSNSIELNLSHYIPSVYLLEIKTVDGLAKRRIVVCR